MYYWNLLQRDEEELTVRVLYAQKANKEKYDFYEQIQSDLKELKISLSEDQIKSLSKAKFKEYIKFKVESKMRYELEEKRKTRVKSKKFGIYTSSPQMHLLSSNLNVKQIQTLVNLRTYMLTEAKINFKHQFGDNIWCST